MDVVQRALVYATQAHTSVGQERKYTGEPYIVHPIEVMMLVREHGGCANMQAAALLHDVLEDTPVMRADLAISFGETITALVEELTEPDWQGNRAARKALECDRLANVSHEAQTIKCADLISNTGTIVARDPGFAKVYLREKAAILDVLTRAEPRLLAKARACVHAPRD